MRNLIIGTTTGAIVGATISIIAPSKNKKKSGFLSKFKHKKFNSQIIKRLAGLVYKIV